MQETPPWNTAKEAFTAPGLKPFANFKVQKFIVKLHLLNDMNLSYDVDKGTEAFLNNILILRTQFLDSNPELKRKDFYPAIDFIAMIILFKSCLDAPFDLVNFTNLPVEIPANAHREKAGWDEEVEREVAHLSISLLQLNAMELIFLKSINWQIPNPVGYV